MYTHEDPRASFVHLLRHAPGPIDCQSHLGHVVRTPQFKRWFGDWENDPENASQVVDHAGQPNICYHFTRKGGFDSFHVFPFGSHFGTVIQSNALQWFTYQKFAAATGQAVYPVFLNIKRPALMRDTSNFQSGSVIGNELIHQGLIDRDELDWASMFGLELCKQRDLIASERATAFVLMKLLLRKGFDGVIYENTHEGGGMSWIAFRERAIKSIWNQGTFDRMSSRIWE